MYNFHVYKRENAYIKDFNAWWTLMNFLWIYLGEGKGGACIYRNTWSAFTTELLDGYLQNLVGMKYSWPAHVFKLFRPIHPGVDPGQGKNRSMRSPFCKGLLLQTGRLQQQTECIVMSDPEAYGNKCCYFWFHSVLIHAELSWVKVPENVDHMTVIT